MNKLELAAKFLRTMDKKDGEVALKELKRLRAIEGVAKEISNCPFTIDKATIPKAGIHVAPWQVVLNVSMGYIYHQNLESALKSGELEYKKWKCECGKIHYYEVEYYKVHTFACDNCGRVKESEENQDKN